LIAFSGFLSPRKNLIIMFPPTIWNPIDFPASISIYNAEELFRKPTWKFPEFPF
jgi:hypothetical protein